MTPRRVVLGLLLALAVAPVAAQTPESRDISLVGAHDLQARSAYQSLLVKQGDRFIASVGHHGGNKPNPLTGATELNGTSILDVTDPRAPTYLHHIPGAAGEAEVGGAAMVRVCAGDALPRAAKERWYLLRTLGRLSHEIQTNNLEVDDRGDVYIVDRANTGLHILELTGAARAIAALP